MGYNKVYYIDALATVAERKKEAEAIADMETKTVQISYPEIQEIENKINEIGLEAVKSAVKLSGTADLIKLKEQYEALAKQRDELIAKYKVDVKLLSPQYRCKKCNDTGYESGKLCECVKAIAKEKYYKDLCQQMPLERSTFGNFDLSLYPDDCLNNMTEIFNFCKDYADGFNPTSKSLLFFGRTGLGKTHLSLAIANGVIDKGYSVIYGSSQNFLKQIEDEAFGRKNGDTLNALLDCDLLILDDFGTEFLSSFISSAIYNILNTRALKSMPTVISTNLSLGEINSVYGERIFSRIIGNYVIKQFTGKDIRQVQMVKNNS